ncbi:MAG TPA: thioester reductase domain-containing protein, partial [Micromonosporaceae bacterium]|nr:thioester reductase domain-containing protein [Micromonosporaceae bacterium]
YLLGLQGPSKVVDTSCSSSLVAVHEACQALRLRECDLALAGGVNAMLSPYGFVIMSKFRALAGDGRCKTFDASADGYARGEGVGVVVLKRLADAIAASDPIVAVVRGSAVNHDGRSSGLTVPNPAAQQAVITAALKRSQIDPAHVDYVEAHGTGTALGDPIELRALEAVIGRHHTHDAPLLVGSVKTNIGHLESAAGIAGLIKVALAIEAGEVPPHLHLTDPNPNVDWHRLHVQVPRACTPWPDHGRPRVGAVSSFGASGTNAHAVLSSPPPPLPRSVAGRGHGLFLASARTEEALVALAERYVRHLRGPAESSLGDVCFTTHVGRAAQARGLAVVASTVDELADALEAYAQKGRGPGVVTGVQPPHRHRKVAWLFTGQGSQFPGMGRQLATEPAFQDAFDACAQLFDPELDRPLREVVWPEPGQPVPLEDTRYTQPALFTVEYALAQLWLSWGLHPAAVAGHSIGEIVAACLAGVFGLADAVRLVAARARLMAELPPGGAMAAVFCGEDRAREVIAPYPQTLAVAAVNGPGEVVISGAEADVAAVLAALDGEGVRARRVPVSHAFHSPLIAPMLAAFREVLDGISFAEPQLPVISNVTGGWLGGADIGPDYWVRHAAGTVRFADGMQTLHGAGVRTFLELGPQPVLSALGNRCLNDPDTTFVPTLRRGVRDEKAVLAALGAVCLRGARPDWAAFHAGEDVRRVPLPTTVWRGVPYWFREAEPPAAAVAPPAGVDVPGVGRRLRATTPTYEVPVDRFEPVAVADRDGRRFAPLGALVDLAVTAAGDCLGGSWACVEDLAGQAPVPVDDPGRRTVQLSVVEAEDGGARWEVLSLTAVEEAAGAPWRRHACGVLRRRPAVPQPGPVQPGLDLTGLDLAELDEVRSCGEGTLVVLAPAARRGWSEVLAAAVTAVANTAREAAPGGASPGDATAAGTAPADRPAAAGVATGCAALTVTGNLAGTGDLAGVRYVRVRADALSPVAGDGGAVGTAELLDADGAALGYARDLRVVPLSQAGAGPEPWRDPAELLYEVEWQEPPDGSAAAELDVAGASFLVVADGDGPGRRVADRLAAALRDRRAEVTVAPPPLAGVAEQSRPDPESVRALLDSWCASPGRPAGVLVLTGLDAPAPAHADAWLLDEYAARADLMVVALVQQLAARQDCDGARVTVVTRGAVATGDGQDAVSPLGGTLWGLGRVLALEHADRWGGAVDLDPAVPADDQERLEEELLAALATLATEDQQALRGGRRLVARLLARPPAPAELRPAPPVRGDGTYLITGGFGGIGVALAEWLARAGAGRLVLLGRTPLPDRSRWDDAQLAGAPAAVRANVEAVRRVERLGAAVEVLAADVTDEAAMMRVFAALDAGPMPLRGVVHAAGVSAPQYVRDVTPEEYRRVWRPKVVGGWLLHQLSHSAGLDFFLGFSSIAATWGSQHLASYAAGNAFLDSLAQHRWATGQPGLSVSWGPWELASSLFGEEVMSFLRATGLRPLSAPQCLRLLGGLLAGDRPHRVVCAVDWSVFKPVMEARSDRPMLHTIEVVEAALGEAPAEVLGELRDAPADAAAILHRYLRGVLGDVLGADPAGIDADADVMGYGLDSLMVMEVVGRCKRDLRVTVRASELFARTTLADWVGLLAGELGLADRVGLLAGELGVPAGPGGPPGAAPVADGAAAADGGDGPQEPAWIARDVTLDDDIVASTRVSAPVRDPREVLLTGATGFVGAYLLRELLAVTSARVHCLVRCSDEAQGRHRVRTNLERYLPWPDGADERVAVVAGDLGEPRLGLDPARFEELAGCLDAIYHNGAWVNFSYTYEQMRPVNVAGTAEILRLAGKGRATVHHVSTYGIWGLPVDGRTTIREDDDIAAAGRLVTGYVQTKWAAERMVELGRERGIAVDLYRPGRVLGDSRTGACLTTHFTTRVIKGCIQLGMAPDIDIEVEMTPVDYVAAGLVRISLGA